MKTVKQSTLTQTTDGSKSTASAAPIITLERDDDDDDDDNVQNMPPDNESNDPPMATVFVMTEVKASEPAIATIQREKPRLTIVTDLPKEEELDERFDLAMKGFPEPFRAISNGSAAECSNVSDDDDDYCDFPIKEVSLGPSVQDNKNNNIDNERPPPTKSGRRPIRFQQNKDTSRRSRRRRFWSSPSRSKGSGRNKSTWIAFVRGKFYKDDNNDYDHISAITCKSSD